jgi:hypothetical protein
VTRMNWHRVNRENRALREERRAPSGRRERYDPSEMDRWPRAEEKRPPKNKIKSKCLKVPKRYSPAVVAKGKGPTVPWGTGTSKKARQRRRRRQLAEIEHQRAQVR